MLFRSADEAVRRRYRFAPLPKTADQPNESLATHFELHAEITVPSDQTAITAGRLLEVREQGQRRTFVYAGEQPVNGFPIVAARYAELRGGDLAVYYHPRHGYNAAALLDVLAAARQSYETAYGPLPQRDLRFAEFPGLTRFAISFPTAIPCSESLVFLTQNTGEHVNANYFAVAHEVAHQWFGNLVAPARGPGGDVLMEGLAEYSAGALIEDKLGRQAAGLFRGYEESTYLQNCDPDHELPLAAVDRSHRSHDVLVYQKAGLVFHMLEQLLGRTKMNAALREYVTRFRQSAARPTLDELLALFKQQDGTLNWFYEQWFQRVTLPDFQITSAAVRREGAEYVVEFIAGNAGQGRMPVTIEAIADDEKIHVPASATITLSQDSETRGILRCAFRPARLTLDRRRNVLDTNRSNNELRF